MKEQKKPKEELCDQGMVVYTDGSCRPVPGLTGYGVHGYTYDLENEKKTKMIMGTHVPTSLGYYPKDFYKSIEDKDSLVSCKEHSTENYVYYPKEDMRADKVYIDKIFDIYGSRKDSDTNNTAELDAPIAFFNGLLNGQFSEVLSRVVKVHLLLDSKYTLGAMKNFIEDNTYNPESNGRLIIELGKFIMEAEKLGIVVTLGKVKGHSGDLGNDRADLLSNMGRNITLRQEQKKMMRTSHETSNLINYDDYWSKFTVRNPVFNHRLLIRFSKINFFEGLNSYFMVRYKEEGDIGKRFNDAVYTIYLGVEPDETIASVDKLINQELGSSEAPYLIKLDTIYSKEIRKALELYKNDYVRTDNRQMARVITLDDVVIANEIYPLATSYHAEKNINYMLSNLKTYLSKKESNLKLLSIKDLMIDVDDKGKQFLKKEIVNDKFKLSINTEKPLGFKQVVKLDLGLDLPKRNTINRLAKDIEDIVVVLEDLGRSFRYSTVVSIRNATDGKRDDIIYTVNKYANVIVKRKKPVKKRT